MDGADRSPPELSVRQFRAQEVKTYLHQLAIVSSVEHFLLFGLLLVELGIEVTELLSLGLGDVLDEIVGDDRLVKALKLPAETNKQGTVR